MTASTTTQTIDLFRAITDEAFKESTDKLNETALDIEEDVINNRVGHIGDWDLFNGETA